MKTGVFVGDFEKEDDIIYHFKIDKSELNNCEIIIASYDTPGYEGYATVIIKNMNDGLYYEVNASHCSCYGLENQWDPELIGNGDLLEEYSKRITVGEWDNKTKIYDLIY